jgi:hypothetical protein
MPMNRFRTAAVLLSLALLATACGARLTDEQREIALRGVTTPGGVQDLAGAPGEENGLVFDDLEVPRAEDAADPAAGPASPQEGQPAPQGAQPRPGAAGDPGQPAPEQPGQTRDTRAAPPGGNGGATDVGVAEDRIVIANVVDRSGAVPGLFLDAQLAVQAYVAKFTATEGTIYGRQLQLQALDAGMSTGGNRNQYLRACEQAFAAVGSMSAFDEGLAPVVRECGIPDVRTAAVTPAVMQLDQVYGPQPLRTDVKRVTEFRYYAEQHPEAVKRAGYLYIDADTTRWQTAQDRQATATIGYQWEYTAAIDLAEHNYAPYVLDLRTNDIRFVTFQGAYQQAARLARAMRQQNYWPDVFALQTNAYTPDLIAEDPQAVQGINIGVVSSLLEEIDANPEMQEYARWLQQVAPGERPSGLGVYAWAAAKLFVQAAKDAGPNLTREGLLNELRQVGEYDANGLVAPHHIGNRTPTTCVIVVEVSGNGFRRAEPSQGMRCDANGLARTPQ